MLAKPLILAVLFLLATPTLIASQSLAKETGKVHAKLSKEQKREFFMLARRGRSRAMSDALKFSKKLKSASKQLRIQWIIESAKKPRVKHVAPYVKKQSHTSLQQEKTLVSLLRQKRDASINKLHIETLRALSSPKKTTNQFIGCPEPAWV